MRAIWVVLVVAGCGGKEEKKPVEEVPRPVVEKATPPAPASGYAEDPGAARWLLVEGHIDTQARARYAAIHIGEGAPAVASLGEAAAMPARDREGHFRTVAAHQGPTWVRATSSGGGAPRFALEVATAGAAPKGRVTVGARHDLPGTYHRFLDEGA